MPVDASAACDACDCVQPLSFHRPLPSFFWLPFPLPRRPSKPLTVEAIFAHGPLIGHPPEDLTWSPDGKHLTYLRRRRTDRPGPRHGQAARAGEPRQAGRAHRRSGSETDRDHRDRYKMASYLWAPDSTHLLFDSDGRLWLYDLSNGTGIQIGFTGADSGDDPKFSPNGESSPLCATTGSASFA